MELLARTFQQGLVGGILDEGMLEEIGRLRWHTALVEQFGVDQPGQACCNVASSSGVTAWSSS